MRAALGAAFAVLALASTAPASANWGFSDDKRTLILEDEDYGLMFLDFTCAEGGHLTSAYSTLDNEQLALPTDASVRLSVAVDGGKRVTFPVVADDKEGSTYGLGDRDAPTLLSLLTSKGQAFTADLRVGKEIFWQVHFDREGYDGVKDQIAQFCPEPKKE